MHYKILWMRLSKKSLEPEKPKAEEFIWTEPEVRENNRDDDFDDDEGPEFIYRN